MKYVTDDLEAKIEWHEQELETYTKVKGQYDQKDIDEVKEQLRQCKKALKILKR